MPLLLPQIDIGCLQTVLVAERFAAAYGRRAG